MRDNARRQRTTLFPKNFILYSESDDRSHITDGLEQYIAVISARGWNSNSEREFCRRRRCRRRCSCRCGSMVQERYRNGIMKVLGKELYAKRYHREAKYNHFNFPAIQSPASEDSWRIGTFSFPSRKFVRRNRQNENSLVGSAAWAARML